MAMTLGVIESLEGLEKLAPEWGELYARCPRATPFQAPQWLLPWTRHVFRGGAIQAVAMRRGGELAGFAPLFVWGEGQRTVSFLGAGVSDYGDLLFAPGLESECAQAVWHFLKERRRCWDAIDLREVRCGSGLLSGQKALECSVCPALNLNGWPESMDPKQRIDVRRACNKLRNMKPSLGMACSITEFFPLYEARWGAMDETLRRFHTEVAAGFQAAGLLRLGTLRIDGAPVAAMYAFRTGTTLYCYLGGFDPAAAKLSPGAVLLRWMIGEALAEGIKEIDFLRDQESWKYLWGARGRPSYRLDSYTEGTISYENV